jgi:heterodisulfide reductase subunit A
VTLVKKPRYIDEDKCRGCTTCVEYCPVQYPDQFNQSISKNKAIHIYYSQAIPLISYIDESCLYLKEKKCRICERVCENKAIDFNQAPEKIEVNVGAIILAPGLEPFDPRLRGDYGYGKMQNVVTSLDFERILCATGPYEGEIRRPSDGKPPQKIAWIQCVGSRQVIEGGNSYCSAVCCTYTQKQVILAKDHDAKAECTVFHNDIRSHGKDFERFYERAQNLTGVRFIRSYVSLGREVPENKNITLRYTTPEDGVKEEEFELVVLSVGLNPPTGFKDLAGKFGIGLDSHGFCQTGPVNPIETSRPGIFVSGAFQGPMDIPESVYSASGATSQCGAQLNYRRHKLTVDRQYPPEKDVSAEEPRIGVFVCHCGANIGRVVDVPAMVEYAATLPHVVHSREQLFSCATNCAQEITDTIKEKNLNRVVVAACSPRTLEPLFRDTLREAGINQYYFEMANIREHDSWVHSKEPEEATQKARDIIRMSVARAHHLKPLKEYELPVNKAALVVGGGIAGMTCALSIAAQGHEVHLVEKETGLGGIARRIYSTLEGLDVQAYLRKLISRVYQHPLVHVYTGATITDATGYVGNFVTRVKSDRGEIEIKHGAAVIATGAEEYRPAEYLYGQDDRVMTNLELEEQISIAEYWKNKTYAVGTPTSPFTKGGDNLNQTDSELVEKQSKIADARTLVMVQCVGCRNEDRDYCSRVCCSHSVKNALKLKEINPEMDIYILYRDMRTYGLYEDYYREAADREVKFIRYEPDNKPQVELVEEEGQHILRVTVADPVLGQTFEIDTDMLALAAAVIPPAGNREMSQLFKVSLGPNGFFKEAHVKLKPVDFSTDGVFLCGMAHYPRHIPETISQAYGAAGRVLTLLSQDTVTASGSVCEVVEKKCIGCGACTLACTYGAIDLQDTPQGKKAKVNPVLCKGDGLCTSNCPTNAISLQHFTDEELFSEVDVVFPDSLVV